MSTFVTEADLVRCFREIDRGEVELSPDFAFPLPLDETLVWTAGPRAFLVYREHGKARGIVFHRNPGGSPEAAAMCEGCHVVRAHGGVKLMSVRSDERRSVGVYLCSDLSCARHAMRRIAAFAGRTIF